MTRVPKNRKCEHGSVSYIDLPDGAYINGPVHICVEGGRIFMRPIPSKKEVP